MDRSPECRRILLVDDDETFRQVLASELSRRGHEVAVAATGGEGLSLACSDAPEVILLDLRLPDMDGLDVLGKLRERNVVSGVVVLTGHGTIDTAIQAIRLGAHDYLEKPCQVAQVELALQKTHEHLTLIERQRVLQDGYSPPKARSRMVGKSAAFNKLRDRIARIARVDSTALIRGETGVGKELVAARLHAQSARADAPFVVVDCAVLDEDLLHSELFGHERGAFTSATRSKHGLFEVAHGGTLFLDEVGDTTPSIQAKLLRVLETGRFRHLGGTREIAVDVRVVSATNRNLEQAISKGRFREDLYFRLATFSIHVPPLRERTEDIPVLVEHYTERLNRRLSLDASFSNAAVAVMQRHSWPGNVRELIHTMEQAMVLGQSAEIGPDDLPAAIRHGAGSAHVEPLTGSLREMQRRHILSVLEDVGGNRRQAAQRLEISERNLRRLLKKYEESASSETNGPPVEDVED
ncbi:MAG: response regulator [Acidobacteria bacterium]|nr:response regulator [Acidobacteriota bacterium]NIO60804.1 response regulator [Acidobacteriota bacterium]NIQ31876.1 response regulator [Acidobacteriota bacterium]NIQ87256.1 response regulator [Acidobacteriota bacterium]NIT12472.1 response regulator [Acidobacteriota bacterium]